MSTAIDVVRKSRTEDLTGRKFGRLTVVEFAGYRETGILHKGKALWLCVCDCGSRVTVIAQSLKSSWTRSCGCYMHERTKSVEKGQRVSDALRRKFPAGRVLSLETRNKMRVSSARYWANAEAHIKAGRRQSGRRHSADTLKLMRSVHTVLNADPKRREKISKTKTRQWEDIEYARMVRKAQAVNPTKLELAFDALHKDTLPGEYVINTHAEVAVIGSKIPDFVHTAGKKKVVELWGDYWHRGQNPQDRIDYFKRFGYDTLIVWEHEMKDIESVKAKLLAFNQKAL
jgi:hypothetical protein